MTNFEEKPRKFSYLYLLIIVLIGVIFAVYFIFFAPEQIGESFLTKFLPFFKSKPEDLSLVPEELKKDITGGLIKVKLDTDILNHPLFQSLKVYAEPVELQILGRSNPFIPY